MNLMTIGKLSKKAGVGIETIRFYERQGLLEEPQRRESGYRQYSEDVIIRLHFIKRAKELGFSLKEISELLNMRVDPQTTCAAVKKKAEAKVAEIDEKIKELKKMKRALVKLSGACTGRGPTSECPLLDALDSKPLK